MFQDLNPLDRSTAMLEIALMLLGAAMIGFVIAWVARRPRTAAPAPENASAARIAALEKALADAKATHATLHAEIEQQAQTLRDKEAQWQQARASAPKEQPQPDHEASAQAQRQIAALTQNIADLSAQLQTLQAENKQLAMSSSEVVQLQATIAALKAAAADSARQLLAQQRETADLQAALATLRNEKSAAKSTPTSDKELDWLKKEKEDLEQDVRDLESRIDRLEKENSDLRMQARDKSAAGPALEKLTKERDRLKAELDKLKKTAAEQPLPDVDFSHLGTATADQQDDLVRINGIGPVIATKLNQLGIYTFAQISRFSEADMARIDEVLQLFPGRVQRENWVTQAQALL